jgi:hypothetical protein
MRQHQISEESVVLAIEKPDELLPSTKNRYNALKRMENKIIRLVS